MEFNSSCGQRSYKLSLCPNEKIVFHLETDAGEQGD
jgi:hypothetical protein